jgi:hypothetical protein
VTPEEVKAGRVFPRNGGRPELTKDQQAAMDAYWKVRGHPEKEQAAVLKLAELGLAPGVNLG